MTDDSAQQPTENDQSAQHSFDLGNQALKTGHLDEAIQHLSRAIDRNPEFAEAYFWRGFAYGLKKEWSKAFQDLNTAIRQNPRSYLYYAIRAIAYSEIGDLDRAIDDWTEALRCDPEDLGTYFHRASVYVRKGELKKAVEDYTEVIGRASQSYENRGFLARAYRDRAEVYYILYALELAWADIRELEKLLAESEQYTQEDSDPQRPVEPSAVYLLKGKLSLAENNFSEAIQYFQEARKDNPFDIFTHLWLIYARYLEITFNTPLDGDAKQTDQPKLWERPDYQKELNCLIAQLHQLKTLLEKVISKEKKPKQEVSTRVVIASPGGVLVYPFGKKEQRNLEDTPQSPVKAHLEEEKVKSASLQLQTIYYWLGVLYYQLRDFSHAIENLKAALDLDDGFEEARSLLGSIWNFSYRPTWWRWWFCAPKPLYSGWKRFFGSLLLLGAWGALLLPLVQALMWGQSPLAPLYYLGPAILAVAILLSPVLAYLRAGPVEVEMLSPLTESFFPHPTMEDFLKSLTEPKSKTS